MNKLEIVQALISEIEAEQELFVKYKQAEKLAQKKADETKQWFWACMEWKGRTPKKARIQQNALMIRRLMLEIGREG